MTPTDELAAIEAELERRRVAEELAALDREIAKRKVFAHVRTVYPGPEGDHKCDLLQKTVYGNRWMPDNAKRGITPKQAEFLSYEGRECLYGGAAGGGKSWAALMGATQYVDDPGYHALILRRTYKQLAKADSILNVSKEWFHGKARWNGDTYTWTFPSGATIEFGHMEGPNDHLNYQGAVFQFVCYDELTQFADESQYTFLFTRMRRPTNSSIPIRMRATSNPGGPGHSWTMNRFINPESRQPGAHFIPAKLTDNPNLDQAEYMEGMAAVDPLLRRRMLDGDWTAVEGGRFKPEWLRKYWRYEDGGEAIILHDHRGDYRFPLHGAAKFVSCDPASSSSRTADFTVFCVWYATPRGDLIWLDCIRRQVDIPDQPKLLGEVYAKHQFRILGIEAVASNQSMYQFAERLGMNPLRLSPKGQDKLAHAQTAIIAAEAGRLWLPEPGEVKGFPYADIEAELTTFTGTKSDQHDDICDCCPAGTMIRTESGLKPIESVVIGDKVLTHAGRFRAVTNTMSRTASELYRLKIGGREDLFVTGNHRVLTHTATNRGARRNLKISPESKWVSVNDGLAASDFALAVAWPQETRDVESVDLAPFATKNTLVCDEFMTPTGHDGKFANPKGNKIRRFVPVDDEFCRIVGYYAAEGSCGQHQVTFASSSKETGLHEMVAAWGKRIGVNFRLMQTSTGGSTSFAGSIPLRNWFRTTMLARTDKKLPDWAVTLPEDKLWNILIGYLAGDGHYGKRGVKCNTISRTLAHQLREISCRLGMPCAMRVHAKKKGNPQWHIQWSMAGSERIVAKTPSWMLTGKSVRWESGRVYEWDQTNGRMIDDRLVCRIRSIDRVEGETQVFNIAVEEDESYVANGTVVHNCVSYGCDMMKKIGHSTVRQERPGWYDSVSRVRGGR